VLFESTYPFTIREVAAFQRGDKTYLFTAVFASSDTKARDQVRRTIESIIWKS
jgi:hypothetical protein